MVEDAVQVRNLLDGLGAQVSRSQWDVGFVVIVEMLKSSLEDRRGRAAGRVDVACLMWLPLACANMSGVDGEDAGMAVHIVVFCGTGDVILGTHVRADGVNLAVATNQFRSFDATCLGCQKDLDSKTGRSMFLATGALRTAAPLSLVSTVVMRETTLSFDQSMAGLKILGTDAGAHIVG